MGKKKRTDAADRKADGGEVSFDSKGSTADVAEFKKGLKKLKAQPLRDSSEEGEEDELPKIQQPTVMKRSSGKSGRRKKETSEDEDSGRSSWAGAVFFLLMFMPVLIEMVDLGGGVLRGLNNFAVSLTDPKQLATVATFLGVPALLYVILPRKWLIRAVVTVSIISIVTPTLNIYSCSPARLNNSLFGTNFSLKAKADEILTTTIGECLSGRPFTSYAMSAYKPRLVVSTQRSGVNELNLTNSDGAYRIILLHSQRSVRGAIYSINMMAKVPKRVAKRGSLDDLMARNRTDSDVYRFVGRLLDMPASMQYMRSYLQQQNMYVRPVLLETHDIELVG